MWGEAQNFLKIKHTEYASLLTSALKKAVVSTHLVPERLKSSKNSDHSNVLSMSYSMRRNFR